VAMRTVALAVRDDLTPVTNPTFQRELDACEGKMATGAGGGTQASCGV
jgi:hypothetical protein